MRLNDGTIGDLPQAVATFAYDRAGQAVGIVHFGIGAFHRAHQAWYTDAAMNGGDRDWMILGVSLRSAAVADQMNPQDGLYTVTERSGEEWSSRLIGSVREVLVPTTSAARLAINLAAPQTQIISFTVTEKGYCRQADGSLDLALAGQGSIYPLLAQAFRDRRDAGIGGLTLLSCDNLADNGGQLRRLMTAYLAAEAPNLLDWFDTHCTCPSSMVDRIVPATTEADREQLHRHLGQNDEAAVFPERFSQWVIEDRFAGSRPAWERHGAQMVESVEPYETAKLRMLNGAHSALAYLGLERGHALVHQAVRDPAIRTLIERLMVQEAAPTIDTAPGQNLADYARTLLLRFEDSALNHQLVQIAMDGSQKIPQRWLETIAAHQEKGQPCPAILAALGGWLRHIRTGGDMLNDPLSDRLVQLGMLKDRDFVAAIVGEQGLFASTWIADADATEALLAAL